MNKNIIFSILFSLILFYISLGQPIAIPDPNFEQALIDQYIDSDGVVNGSVASEDIKSITSLDVSDKGIKKLTGIEGFEALETLNCSKNLIDTLNVSSNSALKELNCSSNWLFELNMTSLVALENLNCADNRLNHLDVSNNTALKFLLCSSNQITELITHPELNEELTILDCSNNQLSSLDVSQFVNLDNLSCSKNQLTELNLIENDSLTLLDASDNKLTSLDVSANTYLETLTCAFNQLSELDLSLNDSLTTLSVRNNLLKSLDLTSNGELTSINVASNRLESLNIKNRNNVNLTTFDAQNNPNLNCISVDDEVLPNGGDGWLKEAFARYSSDCSEVYTYVPDDNFEQALITLGYDDELDNFVLTQNISSITLLEISGLAIKDLTGIEDFLALEVLECSNNNLESLYLDHNTALTTLICSGNALSNLDLSQNTLLTILDCSNNRFEKLDTSKLTGLMRLDCSNNMLNQLDFSVNTALNEVNCSFNTLEQLELTNNIGLTTIDCSNNGLYTLNISNANNAIISSFNAENNNLICISVDDPAEADAATGWVKDAETEYSDNCGLTYIPDNNFEAYLETHDIDGNLVDISDVNNLGDGIYNKLVFTSKISLVDSLDIKNLSIVNLGGIEDFTTLQYLDCSSNELKYLDLSENTSLNRLKCQANTIEVLDLNNNTALDTLNCSNNALSKLSIKNGQNGNLNEFDASSNPYLYCIEVDNIAAANAALGWKKDEIADYNEDCSSRQTNIPDVNFEQALIDQGYDIGIPDGNVPTSNIEGIFDLDVGEQHIYDLTGIEDFRSLDTLKVYSNYLKTLDVSKNANLVSLHCGNNQLTDFNNLKLNTTLQELICDSNDFTEIELSQLANLTILDISSNNISVIDLNENLELSELYCGINFISELDVSANAQLTRLNCSDNYIAALNLTQNTALKLLDCSNNDLETLDISSNTDIVEVNCDSNRLIQLQFDNTAYYTSFKMLSIDDNEIETIEVSYFPALTILSVSSNKLETLNISSNVLIETLDISNNSFETMSLATNPVLKWLDCSNNELSGLQLESNVLLEDLNGDNNQIESISLGDNQTIKKLSFASNVLETLDLSDYSTLLMLNIRDNQLTEFDTENLINLKDFNCSSNEISALDLSSNSNLEDLNCSDNDLGSLNIKNGNNVILKNMNATNNPNLLCIQVDNENSVNDDWQKDEDATYSDNCHYFETYVPDDAFEQALIDMGYDTGSLDDFVSTISINTITELNISAKGIMDLTGIEDFEVLQILDISGNQISSLGLSQNMNLVQLNVSGNQLEHIDLSNNSEIEILNVSNNKLLELEVNNLTNLSVLSCDSNQLNDLDLSHNANLTLLNCASNKLFTLNIRNGNNALLSELNALNNPDLTCIEADAETLPSGVNWQKDEIAAYSLNCHYYQTYVPDDAFEFKLEPNGVMDDYVSTTYLNQITSLNVSSLGIFDLMGLEAMVKLKTFICSNNNITSIDLSNNLFLENLNAYNNKIESLDVSFLKNLKSLNISNNNVSAIDVSQNIAITSLNVSKNVLYSLDVVSNINLTTLNCSSNLLSSLHINNGFNQNLNQFDSTDNPYLTCILVDNPNEAATKSNWHKDDQASYKLICDDDDNDGVSNEDDLCPNTPFNTTVDLFGCPYLILPNDNFTILITAESCRSSNDGKINISATKTYNYTATIVGDGYYNAFAFTNTLEIRNLRQGNYELCVTIEDWPDYKSCYNILISEPEPLTVLAYIISEERRVSLNMFGSLTYNIDLNGDEFSTTASNIDLNLKDGLNKIKVSTDLDCQGVYEEEIFISEDILVYPNPFKETITIYLGNSNADETEINIFSYVGQQVYYKLLREPQDYVVVNTANLPFGLYIVSVKTEGSLLTFKIVKK